MSLFPLFPHLHCHEVMGLDVMILVFWMLSFKPTFSLPPLTFIKMLFSLFSLSAIRLVSSAYLRLLIFRLTISIPASASSSLEYNIAIWYFSQVAHKLWWSSSLPSNIRNMYYWKVVMYITGASLVAQR